MAACASIIPARKKDSFFKKIFVCCTVLTLYTTTSALDALELSGHVFDDEGKSAPQVNVIVYEEHRHAHTDRRGQFRIENLEPKRYVVRFEKEGLPPKTIHVDLSAGSQSLEVHLKLETLKAEKVIISGFRGADEIDFVQAATVLGGKKLEKTRAPTLVASVENAPGVANMSTGSAVAKPVIRGMGSYRSLLLMDGVPEEAQQFGEEHGTNVDMLDVERVEIVRGPGSLIFGPGAMGGAMNVVTPSLPSLDTGSERFSGKISGDLTSNNPGGAGALSLAGAAGHVGYRGSFSYRHAGQAKTPEGIIPNSQFENMNGSALLGIQENWGLVSLRYSRADATLHLPAAEWDSAFSRWKLDAASTQFQRVAHDRLHLKAEFKSRIGKTELNFQYQKNRREEFESTSTDTSALHLLLDTLYSDLKFHHAPMGPLLGTWGVTHSYQKNQTLGVETLIPNYTAQNAGLYVFEELRFDAVSFLAGLRADTRYLTTPGNAALLLQEQKIQNSAVTGSLGFVWRFANPSLYYINLGRAFRAPTAFELFSNGVHEGSGIYEMGDTSLLPEESLMADTGIKLRQGIFQTELAAYYSRVQNFIFATPTGSLFTDPESGNSLPIYQNKQGLATIWGAELSGEAQVFSWLSLEAGLDFIQGRNETLGEYLPLIPANRVRAALTFSQSALLFLYNPFVTLQARYVARKSEISSDEKKLYAGFSDYTLVSLTAGGDFSVGSQLWTYTLGADNLLNTRYVDYLSRQKLYALNPGITVYFKLTAPFTAVH